MPTTRSPTNKALASKVTTSSADAANLKTSRKQTEKEKKSSQQASKADKSKSEQKKAKSQEAPRDSLKEDENQSGQNETKNDSEKDAKESEDETKDDEGVLQQHRDEAKIFRDHLSSTKAAELRPLITMVRRRGKETAQEQILDLRRTRGRVVLITACNLNSLANNEDDEVLSLHVQELNELQKRFESSLLVLVLQVEEKGLLWKKRSRADKAKSLRKTREVMERLDLNFQVSRPLAVDGSAAPSLLRYFKDLANAPHDIGASFGSYFILDSSGCFYARRDNCFPGELTPEIFSLCALIRPFEPFE